MKYLKLQASRVLVKRNEADEVTPGGIVLPDNSKEKPKKGRVLEIGEDCYFAQVDDVVIFPQFAGYEYSLNNEVVLIMDEEDILAKEF